MMNQEEFDKIYDLGFLKVYAPPKSHYNETKPVIQAVMETFGIENCDNIIVQPEPDYNPYVSIINDLIYSALPNNPLWNGIFRISKEEISTDHYHGSATFSNVYRYTMIVEPKSAQLKKLNPEWAYLNHSIVSDFMGDNTNPMYDKLLEISKKFPIFLRYN